MSVSKCKMCEGDMHFEDEHKDAKICDSCFADDFDGCDLEEKMEVLLK